MNVFSVKTPDYLLRPNFHKLVMLVTMIFIISGLNLIGDNDYSFAQVHTSSPSSLTNNSQQTQESLGSTNRDAILSYEQGNKFLNAKNYDQAIMSYNNAITFDPNWAAPLIKQGNSYFELANYTTAIELYDKAFAHVQLDDYDEAEKCYDRILEIDPIYAPALGDKGTVLAFKGMYREAISFYERALRIDNNNLFQTL